MGIGTGVEDLTVYLLLQKSAQHGDAILPVDEVDGRLGPPHVGPPGQEAAGMPVAAVQPPKPHDGRGEGVVVHQARLGVEHGPPRGATPAREGIRLPGRLIRLRDRALHVRIDPG